MDADQVESSNLHRQIMHTEGRIGVNKAQSGAQACGNLNANVPVEVHAEFLTADNALATVARYDIVLDASDNVATRYLINDACVLLGKPLVYGSALRMEGQLTVFNYKGGPCYRCMFPTPPPLDAVTDCSDGGVLGPVVGVVGPALSLSLSLPLSLSLSLHLSLSLSLSRARARALSRLFHAQLFLHPHVLPFSRCPPQRPPTRRLPAKVNTCTRTCP